MSLTYVKESLKKLNESTLQFKLVNYAGSGSGGAGVRLLLDERDVTERSTIKIGSQEARPMKPYMYGSVSYSDEILFTVKLDTPIKPGLHKIRLVCDIGVGVPFSTEFEGKV